VLYFYDAGYDVFRYDAPDALIFMEVIVKADRYDRISLFKLARSLLAKTIGTAKSDSVITIAAFVYDYTTTDLPAHKALYSLVVAAVMNHPATLDPSTQTESTVMLL
jgi:hypothetical protein